VLSPSCNRNNFIKSTSQQRWTMITIGNMNICFRFYSETIQNEWQCILGFWITFSFSPSFPLPPSLSLLPSPSFPLPPFSTVSPCFPTPLPLHFSLVSCPPLALLSCPSFRLCFFVFPTLLSLSIYLVSCPSSLPTSLSLCPPTP